MTSTTTLADQLQQCQEQLEAARTEVAHLQALCQTAERVLGFLDARANDGVVTFGFEMDGGIHCQVSQMGGTEITLRDQSSAMMAITNIMEMAKWE